MTEGEVPFFSTPALAIARLMLKEDYKMRNYVTTFQAKINDLSSIHRMAALVALTEQLFNFYQPSTLLCKSKGGGAKCTSCNIE